MIDPPKKDFFISHTAADRQWADWIARQLENAGYSTFIGAWDVIAGENFVHQMRQALAHCNRAIAVLTPRYIASTSCRAEWCRAEWAAAFAKDPTGAKGLILPVRVEHCDVKGLLGPVVFVDLVGLTEAAAREQLLRCVNLVRAKPSSPPMYPGKVSASDVSVLALSPGGGGVQTTGGARSFPGEAPSVWNLPPRDSFFFDREEELLRLRDRLTSADPAVATEALALTGLGGSGKSALAIEYAYRFRSVYSYAWLLEAKTPASLTVGIAGLAQALDLPEKNAREDETILAAVHRWSERNGPWLIIFDDAEKPEIVKPFLQVLMTGHVLITSRNHQWGSLAQLLAVDMWPRAVSIIFLMRYTEQDDAAGAERLAAALGDLPLALKLAASYCAETRTDLTEYANRLERGYEGVGARVSVPWELWSSQIERREIKRQQLERAATAAQRAGIALTQLRYREAAEHFAAAARWVPPGDEDQALVYLEQEADALYRQGEEFGDNDALVDAIGRYRALLDRRTRERVPLQWAKTQSNLGLALRTLGERETGTQRLQEAVEAHRAALQEQTRERVPLQWAKTQNKLGLALRTLGERETSTQSLQEAVNAFRAALQERTRERVPLDWAMTQSNLGNALRALGERESGTARLQEAVEAFRAALQERARERVPLQWAMTQSHLGLALRTLGERETGTQRLQEAVNAFRAALQEQTRERVPLRWATTQNKLGAVLTTLGQRESGTARLQEAVAAHEGALDVFAAAQAAYYVSGARENLERAQVMLAQRQGSSEGDR